MFGLFWWGGIEVYGQGRGNGIGKFWGVCRVGVLQGVEQVLYARSIHKRIITRRDDRNAALLPLRDVNPTRIRPLVTWGLIIACAVVYFLVQPAVDPEAQEELPLESEYGRFLYEYAAIACELTTGEPLDLSEINDPGPDWLCSEASSDKQPFPGKNVWLAALVSMFLHANLAHILFNMWALWIFGNNVEEAFGWLGFAAVYLLTGIVATAGFVVFNPDFTGPMIGASGAIAGVMGAYVVLFPRHRIMTIVFYRIVAIPAWIYLGIWFGTQFLLWGADDGIAWQAHVAGFLAGVIVAAPFRKRLLDNTLNPDPPQRQSSSAF